MGIIILANQKRVRSNTSMEIRQVWNNKKDSSLWSDDVLRFVHDVICLFVWGYVIYQNCCWEGPHRNSTCKVYLILHLAVIGSYSHLSNIVGWTLATMLCWFSWWVTSLFRLLVVSRHLGEGTGWSTWWICSLCR